MMSQPTPTELPIVPYEYLFCPPLSAWFQQPTQRRAQGLLVGSGTAGHRSWPRILDTSSSLQQHMTGEPLTTYQK
jgi:hypothetical protein